METKKAVLLLMLLLLLVAPVVVISGCTSITSQEDASDAMMDVGEGVTNASDTLNDIDSALGSGGQT